MRRAIALAVASVAVTACGTSAGAGDTLGEDLCRAAGAEDTTMAVEVFEADVHTPLHELADAVGEVDREVAARLLEAKFAVESAIAGDAPHTLLQDRLETLTDRARDALGRLDRPAPTC